MPKVTLLDPLAQFNGSDRFLNHFKSALHSASFSKLCMAIAYAKSSGVARIHQDLQKWRQGAGSPTAKLIVGIDQKGTSVQALTLALSCFDEVYIAHTGGGATFHPKYCVFSGASLGRALIGSHNLTCGGTETNLEAGVEIDFTLPAESAAFDPFMASWDGIAASSFTKRLDAAMLAELEVAGSLLDESAPGARKPASGSTAKNKAGSTLFPRVNPAPPSAIPKGTLTTSLVKPVVKAKANASATTATPPAAPAPTTAPTTAAATATSSLVIQLKPHENGEVFLSMTAVYQNPGFFGFPFTGVTTPKKGKTGYPQRSPDPVVEIVVYDAAGNSVVHEAAYNLNTVYYARNKEIRVTMSPHIKDKIAPYSILHMQVGSGTTDYRMEIYNPGSTRYAALLAVCDQTMPSGGKAPRKFGWI